MSKRDELAEAMVRAHGGLDPEVVQRIYGTALAVIEKELVTLREAGWTEEVKCPGCKALVRCAIAPDRVARAMAATAQGLDAVGRLALVAAGEPDRRTEEVTAYRALTAEQLAQVEQWLK